MFLATEKPRDVFFGAGKKPLREARGLTPWFWARTGLEPGLSRENRLFTLHSQHHSLPQETLTYDILPNLKCLSQGSNLPLQSSGEVPAVLAGVRTRCLRGASSVCQPTGQSDDGGPFG